MVASDRQKVHTCWQEIIRIMQSFGLKTPDQFSTSSTGSSREIDIRDDAAVTMEAFDILGRIEADREWVQFCIETHYSWLRKKVDRPGEMYIAPVLGSGFSLLDMFNQIDNGVYPGCVEYPQTFPLGEVRSWDKHQDGSKRLWLPEDPKKEGLSIDEINSNHVQINGRKPVLQARIALKDGPEPMNPLLHFIGHPFYPRYSQTFARTEQAKQRELQRLIDDATDPDNTVTQLSHLARAQDEFGSNDSNQGLEITPISPTGFAMLALQPRIRGEKPNSYGYMAFPQLLYKSLPGFYVTAKAHIKDDGQIRFCDSLFDDGKMTGIGLAVGEIA